MKDEVVGECSLNGSATDLSLILSSLAFPRVPLAVPFWNGETYRTILRCLISGRIVDGDDLAQLKSEIASTLGVDDAWLGGSGSLALEIALRACQVDRGDEVVVPTFCCPSVVAPLLSVGAIPVLADIGDELNLTVETVEPALTTKTKAIIVPHLFGNPADIDAIVEIARGRNIHVIDDAAQALGATIDGRPVGSFGDAGILSFGSGKVCSGIGGGALVSRKEDLLGKVFDCDLTKPQLLPTLGKFFSTLIWHRWRGWTLPLRRALGRRHSQGPDVPAAPYRKESMANLNAAVARRLMRNLRENISARRVRVAAYQAALNGVDGLQLIPHRSGSACLTQVVRVLPNRRGRDLAAEVVGALDHAGYEIQGSYVPIHLLGHYAQCVWDRLPNAERIWADLIELPCEPSVSLNDVACVAAIVQRSILS